MKEKEVWSKKKKYSKWRGACCLRIHYGWSISSYIEGGINVSARKLMIRAILPLSIFLLASTNVFAAYSYSPASNDSSTSKAYSPYYISGIFGYDDVHRELMAKAYNMKWNQTKKNNLLSYKNNGQYYTTPLI